MISGWAADNLCCRHLTIKSWHKKQEFQRRDVEGAEFFLSFSVFSVVNFLFGSGLSRLGEYLYDIPFQTCPAASTKYS